jgi:hypothetical protein
MRRLARLFSVTLLAAWAAQTDAAVANARPGPSPSPGGVRAIAQPLQPALPLAGRSRRTLAVSRKPAATAPAVPLAATSAYRNRPTSLGGPARFDPKKSAALGATLMRPKH